VNLEDEIYDLTDLLDLKEEVNPESVLNIWEHMNLRDNPIFDMKGESNSQSELNTWSNPIFDMEEELGLQSELKPIDQGTTLIQLFEARRGILLN